MRSILGLSVPVMQEFDTPTPTATPSSIVSTPEGTTAVTPTIAPASATLPVSTLKVVPEPASTFIQLSVYIDCSVCAQGKPTGQFTAKQRKRGANDRRCKQCQVDTGGADPFGGVVRAALAEQATKFQTARREQGEAHATQLQALQQFTSKATAAPRQQQLRGFDAPKFPDLAAARLRETDRARTAKPGIWLISRWGAHSFPFGLIFVGKRRVLRIRKFPPVNGIFRIKIKFA
jgi:hypothetical protein